MTLRNQNFTRAQMRENELAHNFVHSIYMNTSGERETKAHNIIMAWRLAPDNLLDAMLISGFASEEDCAAWIEKLPMGLRGGYCPDTSSWKHHPKTEAAPPVTRPQRVQGPPPPFPGRQSASGMTFNIPALPAIEFNYQPTEDLAISLERLRTVWDGTLITRDRLEGETDADYIARQRTVRPNTYDEREPLPGEGYANWLQRIDTANPESPILRVDDPDGEEPFSF